MKLLPALVIANSLNWSFGRLNRIERRRPFEAREIQEYQPDSLDFDATHDSTTRDHGGDVGILSTALKEQDSYTEFYEGSRVLQSPAQSSQEECTAGFVQCDNGYYVDPDTGEVAVDPDTGLPITCEAACGNTYTRISDDIFWSGGDCCSGRVKTSSFGKVSPCKGFTGSVCRDGSCSSDTTVDTTSTRYGACYAANIPSGVVRSCKGNLACSYAGGGNGNIGEVIDSCSDGGNSCLNAAYRGSIEKIINSCKGIQACNYAGYFSGSSTGGIVNSCQGNQACEYLAAGRRPTFFSPEWPSGSIGDVVESCQGTKACSFAASRGGSIAEITNSCNGTSACERLARGIAAFPGGSIEQVDDSCQGFKACFGAAQYGGSIGGIVGSCKAEAACGILAQTNVTAPATYYSIPTALTSCCNYAMECKGDKTQADLPSECTLPDNVPGIVLGAVPDSIGQPNKGQNKGNGKNKDKKKAPWNKGGD